MNRANGSLEKRDLATLEFLAHHLTVEVWLGGMIVKRILYFSAPTPPIASVVIKTA